jgi:cobalt/nickel transport protein
LKTSYKNILLFLLVIFIAVFPLIINKEAAFEGADGEAENMIGEVSPDYEPWFNVIWEPPSGEIESALFALQAVLGSAFIFYFFGYLKGKRENAHER